tara:strand:+ start:3312 stop:3539 length:228 start_codon:yes stop_codon:yes gene_type:complete
MKNPEEIKKIRSQLNTSELGDLRWLQVEITSFLQEDSVSVGGLTRLENIVGTLDNLRVIYTQRVISLLKQGNILD